MHSKEYVAVKGGYKVEPSYGDERTIISSTGVIGLSPKATVKANATTAVVATADYPKNNTNTGATGTIALTLPAAADVKGKFARFQVTAAQIVQLVPASGEKIYLGGDGVADKYLQIAGVIGNYADIYSDGTDYLVMGYAGVLTKQG